jgi:hypothetical protein
MSTREEDDKVIASLEQQFAPSPSAEPPTVSPTRRTTGRMLLGAALGLAGIVGIYAAIMLPAAWASVIVGAGGFLLLLVGPLIAFSAVGSPATRRRRRDVITGPKDTNPKANKADNDLFFTALLWSFW